MTKNSRRDIAILGTGDMGSAVARCLANSGFRVITCLVGRSPRSQELAHAAGMIDTSSLDEMLMQTDVLLSIVPPGAAVQFARTVCPRLANSGRDPLFIDCNAVAAQTIHEIAAVANSYRLRFQDVGIIGAAPRAGRPPVRF